MSAQSAASGSSIQPGRLFALFALLSTPYFVLIAYNSGWGTDPLEYLTIARAYSKGAALFDFIHGKSFGMYALLAALMRAGYEFDHLGLSLAIGTMFALNTSATYFVFSRHVDEWRALAVAVLVGICMLFMEQTYFETEGFVYLSGLAAFFFTCRALETKPRRNLFLAGLALAVGFHFKSVVAFYLVGIGLFALIQYGRAELFRTVIGVWGLSLASGFLVGALVPVVYFAATGRLAPFWEWTIYFPLFHYPAHTIYIAKLWTKLLWFNATILVALGLSLHRDVREAVYGRPPVVLALVMGLCACASLLKAQASHYVFPAAGFLMLFAISVFHRCSELGIPFRIARRTLLIAGLSLAVLFSVSIFLYKPDAVRRLVTLNHFERDVEIAEFLQARVAPDEKVLFVTQKKTLLYWLADRQPAMKSVAISVQTTYYLLRHPEMLLDPLDDPALTLVEFNPDLLIFEDQFFLDYAENRELIEEFQRRLAERFVPAYQPNPWNLHLWARKGQGVH